MSALAQLATSLGRADEQPNIALAERIVLDKDVPAVRELVEILNGKDKALKSDALKALYEVGYRSPELIAPFIGWQEITNPIAPSTASAAKTKNKPKQ